MTYDYLSINFPAVAGIIFLLVFLLTNTTLDRRIKRVFYILILVESIEIITYSLELWTTTFPALSPLRLWLSAIGYAIRPLIFVLMLMLATRKISLQDFPVKYYVPAILNLITSFSVFFTDIVYSYTPDNLFVRGPLGFFTHAVALIYLVILILVVIKGNRGRSKLETLIIFAISLLIVFFMTAEAVWDIRTLGRSSIVMITIFYYMFFQSRVYKNSLSTEQSMRSELELASRTDGLTGLLNKNAFANAATNLLRAYDSIPHSGIALLFVDLDHLKAVNDTFGHAAGDTAITDAANTLRSTFRKTDLVGRFGGDEYCLLLLNIPKDPFVGCLKKIQDGLRREYTENGVTVSVSASIGAVYTGRPITAPYEELMRLADEALYEAKAAGRDCYIIKEI